MLLLVTGDPSIGKDAILTEFLNQHPEWRHLAVEDKEFVLESEEDSVEIDGVGFYVSMACECAQQLQKEDLHLLATCDSIDEELQSIVREAMGDNYRAVHLGPASDIDPDDDFYHHHIDTKKINLKNALRVLDTIISPEKP